jgi:hypothetical protein
MRNRQHALRTAFLAATLASAWLPQAAVAACNAPRAQGEICPILVGNAPVFDRCFGAPPVGPGAAQATPVGSAGCDALFESKKTTQAIGTSVAAFSGQVQRDLEAARDVALRDAVDPEALRLLDSALQFPREIEQSFRQLANDRQCGPNGVLAGIEAHRDTTVRMFTTGLQAGAGAVNAVQALGAAGPALVAALAELEKLRGIANAKGQAAQAAFNRAVQSGEAARRALDAVNQADPLGTFAAGGSVALTAGSMTLSLFGCAGSLATAVSTGVAAVPTVAASVSACAPSAGVGCLVGAVGGSAEAIASATGAALSGPACKVMADGLGQLQADIKKIENFYNKAQQLVGSVGQLVASLQALYAALNDLAGVLGDEAKPVLTSIQANLDRASDAVERSADLVAREVLPKLQAMTQQGVSQLASDASVTLACYNKLGQIAGGLGGRFVTAVGDLRTAGLTAVDAGQVLDNVSRQSSAGAAAVNAFLATEWPKLDQRDRQINLDLWGVPKGTFDLARTGPHLVGLAANPARFTAILGSIQRLDQDRVQTIAQALQRGKDAFLTPAALGPARDKYAAVKAKATAAKAGFDAEKQARAGSGGRFASTIPVGLVAPPSAVSIVAGQRIGRANLSAAASARPVVAAAPVSSTAAVAGATLRPALAAALPPSTDLRIESVSPLAKAGQIRAGAGEVARVTVNRPADAALAARVTVHATLAANAGSGCASPAADLGALQPVASASGPLAYSLSMNAVANAFSPQLRAAPGAALCATVDRGNAIAESNEGNNCACVPIPK